MRRFTQSAGFTLVEVLVASTLLMMVWLATARIVAASAAANAGARGLTQATMLAVEKMEQLRALPIDDPALARSPPGTLATNVEGYHDQPDSRYIRRWSIDPLPSYPEAAVAIHVAVATASGLGEARLVTIKSRKVR